MTASTTTVVVARWTTRPATTTDTTCDECGERLEPGTTQCLQCRQATGAAPTGMLAVVIETAAGDRCLVVAERTPSGGWAPTRQLPATPAAVRALGRQDITRGGAA